jgi:rubredoxin
MVNIQTLRIFTNGGIVSPEELRKIIQVARMAACEYIIPGFRQELYVQVDKKYLARVEKELEVNAIKYATIENTLENIVTSFAALHILPTTAWLLEDTYLDILDSFTYQPGVKINIVDPLQNVVPLFTGELNFVASSYPRYWYLYVHFSTLGKRQAWPLLIDGDDISSLAKLIEEVYVQEPLHTIQELFTVVNEKFTGRSRVIEHELQLPDHRFPQFEGIQKTGSSYWLGIYRRKHTFSLDFLEALHQVCVQTKIGKICLTPHKSLLIKDIREEDRLQWEKLLGLYGVNIGHSAVELNWQLPDLDKEAMQLKITLVQKLEEKEICTAGMSFAIQTNPLEVATCVRIEQEAGIENGNKATLYTVLHTADFSIHHSPWQVFAERVYPQDLADTLAGLCQVYYQQLGATVSNIESEETLLLSQTHDIYQCPDCLTVYDPLYADSPNSSKGNASFQELPDAYTCSICDAPKTHFVLVENYHS